MIFHNKLLHVDFLERDMNILIVPACPRQLMVAEKKGTIRFYDLVTQQAILSLDCDQAPLTSADWCLANTIKVGAAAGNDWLVWDITRSR